MLNRLLFVLLLLVLPLQAFWAATGSYCWHEQGAAAQHFGHHAHQHKAADENDPGGGAASQADGDCGLCHLGGIGVVTSSFDAPSAAPPSPRISPEINFLPSIFPEGPERPRWASAV